MVIVTEGSAAVAIDTAGDGNGEGWVLLGLLKLSILRKTYFGLVVPGVAWLKTVEPEDSKEGANDFALSSCFLKSRVSLIFLSPD